jgi:hypothetical protein
MHVYKIGKNLFCRDKHKENVWGCTKSFWTGSLEQELQMVQLSATSCSCIAIL